MSPGTEFRVRAATPAPMPGSGRGPGRPTFLDTKATWFDFLGILSRRKWLGLSIYFAVLGLTVVTVVRTPPLYQARATMMVTQQTNQASALGAGLANVYTVDLDRRASDCIELLKSESMADRVAEEMAASGKGGLQAGVTAQAVRQTDVIELVATAPSVPAAIAAVNAYLDVYRDYDLEQSRAEVTQTRQFIEKELAVSQPRLDSSERSLEQFRSAHGTADLDAETRALIDKHADVAAALQQAEIEIQASEAQLKQVQNLIDQTGTGTSDKLGGIASPLVSSLQSNLNQLEVEKANLLIGGFGQSSPRVRDLDRQIDSTRSQLGVAVKNLVAQQQSGDQVGQLSARFEQALNLSIGLTAAKARRDALAQALANDNASLAKLPETERILAGLTRDAETGRRINSMLSERYEQTKIEEAGTAPSVKIIDRATSAGQTQPNVRRDFSSGLLLALVLELSSLWVAEYLDNSIHGPRELERRGYSVIGTVPQLLSAGRRRPRRHEDVSAHLITHTDTESSGAETFRMLRTALAFVNAERPLHTIVVTSPGPNEGKSTVAVNLASVLAQAGSRVLLVDADLRHPVLHTVFNRPRKPGLSDTVLLNGDPAQAIFATGLKGLSVLPCGTIPPSPADLFMLDATRALLKRLAGEYDYVVIDTPPVLVAADTPIIGALADTSIVVVRASRTAFDAFEDGRAALLNGGVHLSGILVNDAVRSGRYGRYYYYYYKYHCHYGRHKADAQQPSSGTGPQAKSQNP